MKRITNYELRISNYELRVGNQEVKILVRGPGRAMTGRNTHLRFIADLVAAYPGTLP